MQRVQEAGFLGSCGRANRQADLAGRLMALLLRPSQQRGGGNALCRVSLPVVQHGVLGVVLQCQHKHRQHARALVPQLVDLVFVLLASSMRDSCAGGAKTCVLLGMDGCMQREQ